MIAGKARHQIRQLYRDGNNSEQIQRATGFPAWIVNKVIINASNRKGNRTRSWKKIERQRTKERKMLNTNTGHWQALGMRQLRTPQRCGCGKLTKMTSRHRVAITCYECVVTEKKTTIRRPFRLVAGVVLLMFVAGCASAPSKASVEIKVAGQSVVMNFRKRIEARSVPSFAAKAN